MNPAATSSTAVDGGVEHGESAEERMWLAALDQATADTGPLMNAIRRAVTPNERRVARAVAIATTALYSEETASPSASAARVSAGHLESLASSADVIYENGSPRLTDPMFELWLRAPGLTATGGDDEDDPV